MHYNQLLRFAIRAAATAAQTIMDFYRLADSELSIQSKADDTPVTRADLASNRVIQSILGETGIPILSEETEHEDYAKRKDYARMWVVDPLDGTKEFIKRNDMFCVCIALVEDHRPVMGVVALPTEGVVYFTRQDADADGVGKHVHSYRANYNAQTCVDGCVLPAEIRLPVAVGPVPHVVLGSVSVPMEVSKAVVKRVQAVDGWDDTVLVGVGSCIKQCMVAEGSAALYARRGSTLEWDTAAGQAILEAAGARLLRMPQATPLDYNRPELKNPDFLAVGANVPARVFEAAKTAFGD